MSIEIFCKNANKIFQIKNYGNFKTDFFLNVWILINLTCPIDQINGERRSWIHRAGRVQFTDYVRPALRTIVAFLVHISLETRFWIVNPHPPSLGRGWGPGGMTGSPTWGWGCHLYSLFSYGYPNLKQSKIESTLDSIRARWRYWLLWANTQNALLKVYCGKIDISFSEQVINISMKVGIFLGVYLLMAPSWSWKWTNFHN